MVLYQSESAIFAWKTSKDFHRRNSIFLFDGQTSDRQVYWSRAGWRCPAETRTSWLRDVRRRQLMLSFDLISLCSVMNIQVLQKLILWTPVNGVKVWWQPDNGGEKSLASNCLNVLLGKNNTIYPSSQLQRWHYVLPQWKSQYGYAVHVEG